jgi:antitoxin component of RelBE/YafQ-DinJ toxin-antitoxin module
MDRLLSKQLSRSKLPFLVFIINKHDELVQQMEESSKDGIKMAGVEK